MVKVVVANLSATGKGRGVEAKRIRAANGEMKTLRTLDIASASFGDDLRYVFGRNVAKARKENKRVVGANDVAPKR